MTTTNIPTLPGLDPPHTPPTHHTAHEAAAWWSFVSEPADASASALRRALGDVRAADVVLGASSGTQFVGCLVDAGLTDDSGTINRMRKGFSRWRARAVSVDAAAQVAYHRRRGVEIVIPGDADWPTRFADLGGGVPHAVWVRGKNRDPLTSDGAAALVGARSATTYGKQVATDFAFELAEAGHPVVSGAAFGIDAAAHRGALAAGGVTCAVLACGADVVYPNSHADLIARIVDAGVVASEYPPGQSVARHRFLERNRLIAAWSAATVIVEAARRSGALSTAGHAAELGRPLGAVPGPVTSAMSVGPITTLRDFGATAVATAAHVRELMGAVELAESGEPSVERPRDALGPDERLVSEALPGRGYAGVEEVAVAAGLPPTQTLAVLQRLYVMGFAKPRVEGDPTSGWTVG